MPAEVRTASGATIFPPSPCLTITPLQWLLAKLTDEVFLYRPQPMHGSRTVAGDEAVVPSPSARFPFCKKHVAHVQAQHAAPGTPTAGEGETETTFSVLPSANAYPSRSDGAFSSTPSGLLPDARREKLSVSELQARTERPGGDAGAEVDLKVEELRRGAATVQKKKVSYPQRVVALCRRRVSGAHQIPSARRVLSADRCFNGRIGGMCGAIVTSPLDVVKTRLQSDIFQSASKSGAASASAKKGMFQNARRLAYHFVETGQLLRWACKTLCVVKSD
ncbi:hypothetical protein L7F22_026842 [Adiantum nelumboides]|nr:hypothetical protein [Adiantum nelumboides]